MESRQVIGGGLMRILASTLVLCQKSRHIRWQMSDAEGERWDRIVRAAQRRLSDDADCIASRMASIGCAIPGELETLLGLSSIPPRAPCAGMRAGLLELVRDHRIIAEDAETLRVTLPLEGDDVSAGLLLRLKASHISCGRHLRNLLARE